MVWHARCLGLVAGQVGAGQDLGLVTSLDLDPMQISAGDLDSGLKTGRVQDPDLQPDQA